MDGNNQFTAVEYVRGEIVYVEHEPISTGDTTRKTRLWIVLNPTLGHGEIFAIPITSQPCNGIIPISVNGKDMWVAPAIRNIHVQNIIRHAAFVSPASMEEINNLLMWTIGLSTTVTDAMRKGQLAYESLCQQKDNDPTRDVWFNTLGTSKTASNSQIVKKIRDTKLGEPYYQEDILHLRNSMNTKNTTEAKENTSHNRVGTKHTTEINHHTSNDTDKEHSQICDIMQSSYLQEKRNHADSTKVHIKLFNSFMLNEIHAKAVLSGKCEKEVRVMLGYKSKTWYNRLKKKIAVNPNAKYPSIPYIKSVTEDKVNILSNQCNAADIEWQLFVNAFDFTQKHITICDVDHEQSNVNYKIVFEKEHLMLMSTFGCMLVLNRFGLKSIGNLSREDVINAIAKRIAELT